MPMKDTERKIKIYVTRGDKLCYQIENFAKEEHTDWQIIDSSEMVNDEGLWDEFYRLELKHFPVIQIGGKILRYQPVSVNDLVRYLQTNKGTQMSYQQLENINGVSHPRGGE